ncbi:MAG TPA: MFS transporter [Firmicutes bacterium]|nr:MFS transporter [Bacillota bacterium]
MFNIIILGLVSLLTDISTEMVYPLLPLFLTSRLGATPAVVGLIEGIAESLASILKVFSGYISDRIGKRKSLAIAGYGSSTIGKVVLFLAGSWPWVLVARVIDRFGKGIRTAPRDAIIADSSTSETRGRAYGLHRTLDTLGAATGVLLAYYFMTTYKGDFTKVFLWSIVPAVLGLAMLALVRETARSKAALAGANGPMRPTFSWSKLDRRLKAFLIVVFIFALGNSSNQFLLLRARNIGFSSTTILLVYFLYNIVYSLVSYPAGRLSDRIGRKALLVAGYLAYGLVYLGFALARAPWHIWALFATYGLYIAFTEGVEKALVADIAPPELKATTIGLHATLVGAGLLPASLLAGLLWNVFGPQATFYFGSMMGILAAIGIWVVV